MTEEKYYVAIGPFGEQRTSNDLERTIDLVDRNNAPDGPKWYAMEFNKDSYYGFIKNRDPLHCAGIVIYDPFERYKKEQHDEYFKKTFKRVFGQNNKQL